jgi:hypothetical protein
LTTKAKRAPASPLVNFIGDVPADYDFFDTHTRLAYGIKSAIEGNPKIKVIGLLGRWGSGKSTVAKKLVDLLEAEEGSGFRIFTYDAWLHQSDPLRRSFLESLIGYLVGTNAVPKGTWSAELKKLSNPVDDVKTIETPSLSRDGRWLSLSLLAIPIGVGLLDLDTLKEAFGKEPTPLGRWTMFAAILLLLFPLVMWAALYVVRRPWKHFFDPARGAKTKIFWQFLGADGAPTSALHIFAQAHEKRTETRTFRAIEPTSLEFGQMFQRIMREAAEGDKRLIILIDNLDRIAEDEALQMWATIRSFFLASHETEDVKHEPFHPTVILPIDRYAIEELFAGSGHSGRDRAKSFMDKTFDVTFEVTEPVSSDWRAFLDQQMASMFGEAYQPQWGFWTRRLFEAHLARQQNGSVTQDERKQTVVTPREINKLLNRIGALYLQWHSEGIRVEVMALYVIRRDEIDQGLLAFLQSADIEIAPVAPEWKLQIAALHYGVEVAKAGQVTLEEPIRHAISRHDEAGFNAMSSIPGLREIFEFVTANLPAAEPPSGPFDVLASAVLFLQSLNGKGEDWETSAWRNLVTNFLTIRSPIVVTEGAMSVIGLLSDHVEPETQIAFLEGAVGILSGLLAKAQGSSRVEQEVRSAAEALIEFAAAHKLPAPEFTLEGEPSEFLARFSSLTTSKLWRQIRTAHEAAKLGEALAEMLRADELQHSVPAAVRYLGFRERQNVYAGDKEIDFEMVAATADELVRQPDQVGAPQPGVRVLAELSFARKAEQDRLAALVDEGIMATRLAEAIESKEWNAAAVIVAILLWRGQKFDSPPSMTWTQYAAHDPEHLSRIIAALRRYYHNKLVHILWGAHRVNSYPTSDFIENIIGQAVASDSLGRFDTEDVFANLITYKLAVPYRQRERFLAQVEGQRNFLEALEDAPLGPEILEAAEYLMRKGGKDADQARAALRQRVENADLVSWTAALQSGAEPFRMGSTFIETGDLRLSQKSGLYAALNEAVPTMAQSAGREIRERWFKLAELLNSKSKKALLRALGLGLDQASSKQTLHVMKAGGVQFLKTGGFSNDASRSVRSLILPQLQNKAGLDWLKDNADDLGLWVKRADADTREQLAQALAKLLTSKIVDRRYSADLLINQFELTASR